MLYYRSTVVIFPQRTLNTVSPAGFQPVRLTDRGDSNSVSFRRSSPEDIFNGSWKFPMPAGTWGAGGHRTLESR
jgi:hypothetical protein